MKKFLIVIIVCLVVAGAAYAQFDSLNVSFVGNWPFGGGTDEIVYDTLSDRIFCGCGGGVYILDASDSSNLVMLSDKIRTRVFITGLFYDQTRKRLYVGAGPGGFEIWDVSNPASPIKLGSCNTPSGDVYVSGFYAYVTNLSGVSILRVATSSNPRVVGHFDCGAVSVDGSGSYLYVVGGDYGFFRVLDISDPYKPEEVGVLSGCYYGLHVVGDYAYTLRLPDNEWDFEDLCIVDVSNPFNPQLLGTHEEQAATDVYVWGTNAYLTANVHEISIIDVSDPTDPVEIGFREGYARHVYVRDSLAYITDSKGVGVIDVSDPADIQTVSYFDAPSGVGDFCICGSYVYDNLGKVIDISTISSPEMVGSFERPDDARTIHASGSYFYIPDHRGLRVFDISNPIVPHEVGHCEIEGWGTRDVFVQGDFAYVAQGGSSDAGLSIVDVSNPSSPFVVGFCSTDGNAEHVDVIGEYAYVVNREWSPGLHVIDVSNPSDPTETGYCMIDYYTIGPCNDLDVSNSYAYVAADSLVIIDVSDPSNPQVVCCFGKDWPWPGSVYCNSVHVLEPFAYVNWSPGYQRFQVLDVSSPTEPQEVGYYDHASWYNGYLAVYAQGPYMFTNWHGLQIYENLLWESIEEEPEIAASPIHISTTLNRLSYDLPGQAQLSLYSADGRKVLERTIDGKGTWDAPAELSQGVYFAKLSAEGYLAKTKLIVIR